MSGEIIGVGRLGRFWAGGEGIHWWRAVVGRISCMRFVGGRLRMRRCGLRPVVLGRVIFGGISRTIAFIITAVKDKMLAQSTLI